MLIMRATLDIPVEELIFFFRIGRVFFTDPSRPARHASSELCGLIYQIFLAY